MLSAQVQPLAAGMTGLQLVAKTRTALAALNAAVEGREVRKGYVALISGKLQVGRLGSIALRAARIRATVFRTLVMKHGTHVQLATDLAAGCFMQAKLHRGSHAVHPVTAAVSQRTCIADPLLLLQGRGRVEIPLDGQPSATAWQGVSWVCSYRHTWVSTIVVHPLTGAVPQLSFIAVLVGCTSYPAASGTVRS